MDSEGRPGRYRLRGQNDCEKRASRNSPSLAVALNCGMGSSSLNAEVNAFERLQIVRGRNSSYFGWKYRSCTVRARCLGASSSPLHKRLVDDHLGGDVGEFAFLPGFHLLSHRLKASLHSVDTNRNAVNERERLRVFREHWSKVPRERHVRAHEHAIAAGHRQTHALVVGIPQADGKATSLHLGCEIEDAKGLHAVWRYRVFIMADSNVAKPEGLYQSLYDLVVRDRTVSFGCRWCGHQG